MLTYIEVIIVATPAVWDAIAVPEGAGKGTWAYPYSQARTGEWLDPAPKAAYGVLGTPEEIQALIDELELHTPGDAAIHGRWHQGTGMDDLDNPHDPADVLALMPDKTLYDQTVDSTKTLIGTESASFDTPHWGGGFAGQKPRIFAGQFSDQFSEQFQ